MLPVEMLIYLKPLSNQGFASKKGYFAFPHVRQFEGVVPKIVSCIIERKERIFVTCS